MKKLGTFFASALLLAAAGTTAFAAGTGSVHAQTRNVTVFHRQEYVQSMKELEGSTVGTELWRTESLKAMAAAMTVNEKACSHEDLHIEKAESAPLDVAIPYGGEQLQAEGTAYHIWCENCDLDRTVICAGQTIRGGTVKG